MAIRLVLADDHPIVLHGLRQLFERHPEFNVVETCVDVETTVAAVRARRPDVLVLDLRLGANSGLDVLRTIAREHLPCRTVLLTAAVRDEEVGAAVRLGVMGLVLKESPSDMILNCVRSVHQGEPWIDRETVTRAFRAMVDRSDVTPAGEIALTPREIEIIRMVGQGLRNRAIAEHLSISEGTVKVHLHNIFDKFGVDGRLELVLRAQEKGLV